MNLNSRFIDWEAGLPPKNRGGASARLMRGVLWALFAIFIISILAFCIIMFQPDPSGILS